MSEVIVVTSGKGGVGKTTTAANIGIGLAQLGKKVVMVDTDIGLRNLDVVLGLENRIVYNLVDVIESNCRMKQALIKDKRFDDQLYLLPSAQTRDKTSVTPEQHCGGRPGSCGDDAGGVGDPGRGQDHRAFRGQRTKRYLTDH